jgi:hypothetical protein
MKNIITTLLTATLILMTSVVFSQQYQNPFEFDNAIINLTESSEKSVTRYTAESAFRIKHRVVERKKEANALRLRERNMPPVNRTDYEAIENRSFDNSICIPVVFNIIHDSAAYNTPHNPSDEDILILLELLNEQFTEYVSSDVTIPSTPETGISFVLGIDGSPTTSIRRFDRYDPANEYIVNGDPDDDSDDWPDPIECGTYGYSSSSVNVENFQSRIAYDPENTLNIYLLPRGIGLTSFAYSPWSDNGDFGVWLSSGSCSSSLGYIGPVGGYSQVANYAMLEEGMSSDYYAKFRKTISKSVGHYLGLLNTFTAPDPAIAEGVNWNSNTDCTAANNPWEAMVSLSYLDLFNPVQGPDGGWSQCEYHGDGCCDTPWSSSIYAPLNVSGDHCAHNDASLLVSNNSNPSECAEFVEGLHLQNEAMNRLNIMNYQWGFCERYFFTDDQIARMHDMTNVHRPGVIAAGSTLCLSGDIDEESVFGCIDPIACNYNDGAEINDGTCYYDCCPECTYDWNGDGQISLSDLLQYLTVHGTDCSE